MNSRNIKVAGIALALALAAGCGKKTPDQLPPPPGEGQVGTDVPGGVNDGTVGGAALPGSRADFLQNVPSDRVYFETDSYSVDSQDRAVLDAQRPWLQGNPGVAVTIEGHADERGTREYNLALGDRRANAVKNYLESRGIAASRMSVVSWGKEGPVALGSDEAAWAQNRRAVTVVPQ